MTNTRLKNKAEIRLLNLENALLKIPTFYKNTQEESYLQKATTAGKRNLSSNLKVARKLNKRKVLEKQNNNNLK